MIEIEIKTISEVERLKKQLGFAVETLEKYRTLVIDDTRFKTGGIFRLGKHAEDCLELLAAIGRKVPIMKTVRCKVKCDSLTEHSEGTKSVKFSPVIGGSPENESFYKWTPSGNFSFDHINPNVKFEVGKEYYLDFSIAES